MAEIEQRYQHQLKSVVEQLDRTTQELDHTHQESEQLRLEVLSKTQQVKQYKKQVDQYKEQIGAFTHQAELQIQQVCYKAIEYRAVVHVLSWCTVVHVHVVGALKHQLDIQRQQVNGIPIFVEKEWNVITYQMLNRVLKPPCLFQQQVNGISNLWSRSHPQFLEVSKLCNPT